MTGVLRPARLGLRPSSGPSGTPAQDGLARAENVTLSKDGLLEPRRGLARAGVPSPGKVLDRLGLFRGQLVAHATDGFLYTTDVDKGGVPTEVQGVFAPAADARVRFEESALSLFISRAGGVSRLDAPGGAARPAGVQGGLDAEASLQLADGAAIPGDSQVAYRGVFGTRDANGRLLLGAPTGRAIVQSPALEVPVGALVRVGATGVVTATIVAHGLQVGERFILTGSDPAITDGTFTVGGVTDADHFTFAHVVGADATSTAALFIEKTARNAVVGATIPAGITSGEHFFRVYRSVESVAADVTPGDEMGLVAEVPVPTGVDLETLARTGAVVTGKTAVAHTFTPGTLVRLPTGLPGTSNQDVVIGQSAVRRSVDGGVTWADVVLAGDVYALVHTGTSYVAVGDQFIATSPTGEVWTIRTPAMGFRKWTKLAFGASRLVALTPGRPDIARPAPSSAKTQTTVANVGGWVEAPGLAAGTSNIKLSASLYLSGGSEWEVWPVLTRQFKAELEYRVDGGAWTALGSETKTLTSSFATTSNVTFTLGSLPAAAGVYDVRARVSVLAEPTWSDPHEVTYIDPVNPAGASVAWVTYEAGVNASQLTGPGLGAVMQLSTDDGATWSTVYPSSDPRSAPTDLAWDGSKFVAIGEYRSATFVGSNLRSWVSTDGERWTAATVQSIVANHQAVASDGAGRLVAVGNGSTYFSTNGSSWTRPTFPPAGNFRAVTWDAGHSRFIAVGAGVCATSPDGQTWTASPITGSYYGVTAHGSVALAVGQDVIATSSDGGATWTTRTVSAGLYRAASGSSGTSIPAASVIVTTVPDGTHFTFASPGGFGDVPETAAPQFVSPLTVGLIDTVPTRLLGEAAYWNASQEGILSSHDLPPDCLDLALYRDTMLYAGPKRAPVVLAQLLKVGATEGVQAGDVVQLPGGVVTAGAAEDWQGLVFKVHQDASTPELNLYRTVQSFCRVVNRSASSLGVTAIQTATEESPTPGAFAIVGLDPSSSASISFSAHTSAWSPSQGQTVQPKRDLNLIAYSLPGIPDAVPTLNTLPAGRADAAILRLVPLRDSCLVLKEDGVFRWTGTSRADFAVQPLDLSCRIVAPESAVVLRNVCIALSSSGLVAITDSGVSPIVPGPDPIRERLEALLSPARRAETAAQAFGVAYESEGTYTLWAPHVAGFRVPCAWTFHVATGEFTERTDSFVHALAMPSNDRLWAISGPAIFRERKERSFTDYADDARVWNLTVVSQAGTRVFLSDVGGIERGDVLVQGSKWAVVTAVDQSTLIVTLDRASPFTIGTPDVDALAAIPVSVEWLPAYVPASPQAQMHASELALVYRNLHLANGSVTFTSDLEPTPEEVPLIPEDLGLNADPAIPQRKTVRVLVTRGHQRCTQLSIVLEHLGAYQPFQLEGLALTYEAGTERHSQ